MSLSHRQAREYLHSKADKLLKTEESIELEGHLDGCAECRAYAAELTQLESALSRSFQARWPGAETDHAGVRRTTEKIQARIGRRSWVRRAYGSAQVVAWAGIAVALVIAIVWIFSIVTPQLGATPAQSPTPPPTAVPTRTPVPVFDRATPTQADRSETERALTICIGSEPDTLYLYGGEMLAADHVREAIYDGPFDNRQFGYQPVMLEKLPSLADGDAVTETVNVRSGDMVVNDAGAPVLLESGTLVRPAGCYSHGCAVAYDGSDLKMQRLVVTFTLKPGIKWSDGEPLTALDSVYSFELAKDPDTPTDKQVVARTADYEAVNDFTIVWTGLPGYVDSEYYIRFWTPLPEHIWGPLTALELTVAQESNKKPVGWGPYAITEWIAGDYIAMGKNEHYWRADEGLPRFEKVIFRFFGENSNATLAALLSGDCDIVDQTAHLDDQSTLLLELRAFGKLNATFVTGTVWEHADFGIVPVGSYDRSDFFQDVRVRQGIAHCMDRQAVVDAVMFGQSQVLHTYLSSEHPLFDPDVKQYPHSADRGSALLEEAGWIDDDADPGTPRVAQGIDGIADGTPLAFNYWSTSAGQRQAAAEILQSSLAECGVEVNVEFWSPSELFADGPDGPLFGRHFDMAQFAWLTGVQPSCNLFLCSEVPREENGWTGSNNTGFCSAEYDAACTAAMMSLPGTADYERFHREALRIFAEQLPVVPLYLRLKLAATRPDMQGFIMDPTAKSEFWNIEAFDYGE